MQTETDISIIKDVVNHYECGYVEIIGMLIKILSRPLNSNDYLMVGYFRGVKTAKKNILISYN